MKVVLTGFEPFEGESVNPSLEAVNQLDETIAGAQIMKAQLPTVFGKAIERLQATINQEQPDVVICIGQAKESVDLRVERVAINLNDARIPDNEGQQPFDEPIFADGPNAYFTNLPAKAMVAEIRKQKIPASLSYSAGTFVCNHIMYGLLYLIDKQYPNMRGGFIHVPYIPEQVLEKPKTPSMALSLIIQGLHAAVTAAVTYYEDIKTIEGTLS
ncbi:pyrrolidone-carboxylate peptidase [Candidatus Vecturithrix granuli]|uniref:Pyrrolidone-carboxylate peptidase n=1 Tax=Vecturithrix granuli TaxID=1499967 RepID=A0A081C4Q4_VECG1|nr:pyrrolidone-carboxylate peptidase [Candidatus Vecturithrix granuli]